MQLGWKVVLNSGSGSSSSGSSGSGRVQFICAMGVGALCTVLAASWSAVITAQLGLVVLLERGLYCAELVLTVCKCTVLAVLAASGSVAAHLGLVVGRHFFVGFFDGLGWLGWLGCFDWVVQRKQLIFGWLFHLGINLLYIFIIYIYIYYYYYMNAHMGISSSVRIDISIIHALRSSV